MDYTIFQAINNLAGHSTLLDKLMIYISKYGIFFYGLILLGIFLTGSKKAKIEVFKIGFTGLIALGVADILGKIYYRPRPFLSHKVHLLYAHQPDGSFPSDHVTGGFTLALGIYALSPSLGVLVIIYTLLMAFSRVYVGHHYPLDVLGGIVIGSIVYFGRLPIERKFLIHKTRSREFLC